MRIGELAERAGTTTRALRYYESLGLLTSRRDQHGHRTYGEDALRLLRQIRTLQAFGFGLEETRPFVECLRAGHPAGDICAASLEVYRSKLAELETCIAQLGAVRDTLRARLSRAETLAKSPAQAQAPHDLPADLPTPPQPRCELASQLPPHPPRAD